MKKIISLLTILVFSSATVVLADTENRMAAHDVKTMDAAKKFREIHGLNSSDDYLNRLHETEALETDFEKEFGFPLRQSEETALEAKNKQMDKAGTLLKNIEEKNFPFYGGASIDPKTEELTIYITNTEGKDEIISLSNDIPLVFKEVEFSKNELNQANKAITDNLDQLKGSNINSYTIDEKKNRIIIYSDFDKEVDRKRLEEIIDPKYIIYEKANFKLLSFDLPLGEYIHGRNSSLNINSTCSSGFYAANSSNIAVLVTAGHCNRISIPMSWYKGHYTDGDFVGNFGQKVASTYQNSDASTILLSTDVNITPSIGYLTLDSVKTTNETHGQTIYYKGFKTGANYGTYSGGLCVPPETHGDPDMGTLCDLGIIDGVSPEGGDSGGVIFTVPGGARLYGILTGGMDTDDDGDYDKAVYSRVDYIYDDLNLSSIIVDD